VKKAAAAIVCLVCFAPLAEVRVHTQVSGPTISPPPEVSHTPAPVLIRSPEASPQPTPTPAANEADLIHFGDVIDVDVLGGFEYDWRGRLTPEGDLDGLQALADPIHALCRSESEVAADIVRAYSKTLRDPQVVVKIVDRSGRAVAMLDGAVRSPTRFRLLRPVRLRELIVAAGGLTDEASGQITIFRPADLSCVSPTTPRDNAVQTINITISDLLAGKESADARILSGDLITVDKAVPIYVIGAVNNPRPIYSRAGMTLTRAIATAGGLAKGAVEQKVTVFRHENGDSKVVEADLEKIRTGASKDVELKAFDIIEVAFRGGATRKYPPAIITGDKRSQSGQELPLRIID
jgi:protein involved in polysaccharide export with SLBB domain